MDWKLISICFQVFQFVFLAVVFSIIKFNDFKHLEDDVSALNKDVKLLERKQNERHEENLKAIGTIAKDVSYLRGIQDKK